ncbi:MAG: hypothetical protein H0U48_03365 [Euzebyaceae bacterium]|nr:hypothetical protein [Euzebyaceae bacterium]
MPRATRPSDVHRLPPATRPPADGWPPVAEEPAATAVPRRQPPRWLLVVGLLVIGLIAFNAARTARSGLPGDGVVVDVVAEDQAIAILGLYQAEADALRELQYPPNGGFDDPDRVLHRTPELTAIANRGAAAITAALRQARATGGTEPLVERYLDASDHQRLIDDLGDVAEAATAVEELESVHQAVIESSDAPLSVTWGSSLSHYRLVGDNYAAWAKALMEHRDGRDRTTQAGQARAATVRTWWERVRRLEPGSMAELHFALRALPDATIAALRGHPVAGPVLRRLDSTGTPS